ncbi:DNA double-strand break repair nuclease NurA [Candidatus Woesearchaeota archaeon]|nr:DNA double-strand break repair nuclease NurA [Candidatus Woesearchaeota archaeon]
MYEKIVSKINEIVSKECKNILIEQGKAISISKDNFHKIEAKDSNNKIVFIDGGNAEILKAVNFSLQVIRIGGVVLQKNKKIKSEKKEFYVLIYAFNENSKLKYKTELFGDDILDNPVFDSMDKTITNGQQRADIAKIGGICRRFSEISFVKNMINELSHGDIIVLDGSLRCCVTNEKEYMQELYDKAAEKGIIVSALAKTSRVFSDQGGCFITELNKFRFNGAWYYYPVVELNDPNYQARISFVKLNEKSNYIFNFEQYKGQEDKVKEVVGLLNKNSNDAVFPGYPYGLILADKLARISNKERDYLLTMFQIKAGKEWNKIKEHLNVLDAHDILDNIG